MEYLFAEKGITPHEYRNMPISERAMIKAFCIDIMKQRKKAQTKAEKKMKKR